jgi:nitrogen regulatory protein P-II 1
LKELKAIIQPFQETKVIQALQEIEDLPGVTVSEVRGFGKSRAVDAQEKVVENLVPYSRKVKLEIVVPDDLMHRVLKTILEHAHTGNPGDGKIFISKVIDVVKISTGQRGDSAI